MSEPNLPDVLPIGTRYTCSSGLFELLEPSERNPKSKMPWSEKYRCVRRRNVATGDEFPALANSSWLSSDAAFTLPARPIQAGDWVECVRGSGNRLAAGQQYRVESVFRGADNIGPLHRIALAGVDHGAQIGGWDLDRFKLVDGPHQTSSVPVWTGKAQSSGAGEVTTCSECHAPAKLDPDNSMCAYCCTSTGHGDETRREQDAIMRWSTDTHHGAEARARLEAWSRAEKPRVTNTADQREFRKPHPWDEFDDLESR